MAHVYDNSSNMDEEIEWVSDTSDYESDQETPSLPNGKSPIIGGLLRSSKGLQTEILMEMSSMLTLLLFSHINHLKRMQIIKRL